MMSLPDFKYKQCIFYFSAADKNKLCFRADNILIEHENGKVLLQHSCHRVFALFIVGNITLTNVVIKNAGRFGFPVVLLSRNFRIDSYFNNCAEGNFILRKKQYDCDERKLFIAKELIKQKINNHISLLMKLRKRSKLESDAAGKLHDLNPAKVADSKELLGVEGTASKIFFSAYFRQLEWNRREPRTKRDIPNLLLDIGYTHIFNFVEAITALYLKHLKKYYLCL